MKDFTVDNLTDEVVRAYTAQATSPRARQIFESLIKHLHAFVRDIEPTEAEWLQAIEFLTATGKTGRRVADRLAERATDGPSYWFQAIAEADPDFFAQGCGW